MSILRLLAEHFDLSGPDQTPELVGVPAVPFAPFTSDGYRVAYAYNPGQGASSNGCNHLIVVADLRAGRLHRKAGDALCKPSRKFWGLDGGRTAEDFERYGCKRCRQIRDGMKPSKASP